MSSTGMDNDTRGWIMCIVSGIGERSWPVYLGVFRTDLILQHVSLAQASFTWNTLSASFPARNSSAYRTVMASWRARSAWVLASW